MFFRRSEIRGCWMNSTIPSTTASDRLFLLILSVFLILPHYFAAPWVRTSLHLGLPRVITGDEPHYLVLINSLLKDGDLDVKNNYESSRMGDLQAGEFWSGKNLDHQTVWYEGNQRMEGWRGQKGTSEKSDHPEYSTHGPGLSFLLYPFLYLFKGTSYVEPLSVYFSGIVTVLAMLTFWYWVRGYVEDSFYANLITLVTFLGTPAWHYGRTLYTEPYLLFFGIAAYYFAMKKSNGYVSGLCIALGMLMKSPFILLMFPLLTRFLFLKNLKAASALLVFPAISLAVILALNQIMFGSPFRTSQIWEPPPLFRAMRETLFDLHHGLFFFAPAAFLALLGWPVFFRSEKWDAYIIFSGFLLYFGFMMLWPSLGRHYGPRHVLPVVPFLFIGAAKIPKMKWFQKSWMKVLLALVSFVSIQINFLGAVPCWKYISKHPWMEFFS